MLETSVSLSFFLGKLGLVIELRRLNEFTHVKYLEEILEQIKCLLDNIPYYLE